MNLKRKARCLCVGPFLYSYWRASPFGGALLRVAAIGFGRA
jgi:hypothetical protein